MKLFPRDDCTGNRPARSAYALESSEVVKQYTTSFFLTLGKSDCVGKKLSSIILVFFFLYVDCRFPFSCARCPSAVAMVKMR